MCFFFKQFQLLFKSGRVVATMIGGIILLQKRYTAVEYFGVFCIAIGLAVCTFADFSVLPTFNVPGMHFFWVDAFNQH